jgi:hypothetical protein
MKTVYLDNNAYKVLLTDDEVCDRAFSLKRGKLLFESSIFNLAEFAAVGPRISKGSEYSRLIQLVSGFIRKDRVFCLLLDLLHREAEQAALEPSGADVWYYRESIEHRNWSTFWSALRKGRVPDALAELSRKEKDEYERAFEPPRKATREDMKRIGHDPNEPPIDVLALINGMANKHGIEYGTVVAQDGYLGLKEFPELARQMVQDKLHGVRTLVKVDMGFAAAKEAAHNKHIIIPPDLKPRGVHDGSEHYDIRHAVCGRYADYFVTHDDWLRAIVNSIGETNCRGMPYRAMTVMEFLGAVEDELPGESD